MIIDTLILSLQSSRLSLESGGTIVAELLMKGTVILVAAALVSLALRRRSAAARHLAWVIALVSVLVLPLLALVLPVWSHPALAVLPRVLPRNGGSPEAVATGGWPPDALPAASRRAVVRVDARVGDAVGDAVGDSRSIHGRAAVGAPGSEALITSPNSESAAGSLHSAPLPAGGITERPRFMSIGRYWRFAVVVWLAGCAAVLLPLVLALVRLGRLARDARPADPRTWRSIEADVVAGLGLRRRVRLLEGGLSPMPMTWGVLHPVVLLPAAARGWTKERRHDVLLHELAHVQRMDCFTQIIAQVACAVHWFNPLVWFAAARLRVERELACDDAVIRAGTRATDYATHLLAVARSISASPATSHMAVAMARSSSLETRLRSLLDAGRRRSDVPARLALPAWAIALALVVLLSAFGTPDVRADPRKVTALPAAPVRSHDRQSPGSHSPPAGAARQAPGHIQRPLAVVDTVVPMRSVSVAPEFQCPARRSGSHSVSVNSDDESTTIRIRSGDCTLRLESQGRITFNNRFTDVTSISPRGHLDVEEDDGETERRIEIRSSGDGTLSRRWFVDGEEREYGADARAWLASVIVELDRASGFVARERAAAVMQTQGVQGVVAEIPLLRGDYVRRMWLGELIGSGQLDAAGVRSILQTAAREIGSDYEMAELLLHLARSDLVTPENHAAYVGALVTIGSDYEQRRAMQPLLATGRLEENVVVAVLDAARSIESDYELAELLIGIARTYMGDGRMRAPFFAALEGVGSDYERRRVLDVVLAEAGGSNAVAASTLQAAAGIDSDYEQAELLLRVPVATLADPVARAAFFERVATIASDYEHGRVLSAVVRVQGVGDEVLRGALESSASMSPGYERAEFLVQLARGGRITAALRPAFMKAADGIRSEYEYGRVMAALRNGSRAQ